MAISVNRPGSKVPVLMSNYSVPRSTELRAMAGVKPECFGVD